MNVNNTKGDTMSCPICERVLCDHSPAERGQNLDEMLADMSSPAIVQTNNKWKEGYEDGLGGFAIKKNQSPEYYRGYNRGLMIFAATND